MSSFAFRAGHGLAWRLYVWVTSDGQLLSRTYMSNILACGFASGGIFMRFVRVADASICIEMQIVHWLSDQNVRAPTKFLVDQ